MAFQLGLQVLIDLVIVTLQDTHDSNQDLVIQLLQFIQIIGCLKQPVLLVDLVQEERTQVARILEERRFTECDLVLQAGQLDHLHQEIQHERRYQGDSLVHDLEEDTQLVRRELDEVDGVLHHGIIGIGLQTDELLHLDIVVLA